MLITACCITVSAIKALSRSNWWVKLSKRSRPVWLNVGAFDQKTIHRFEPNPFLFFGSHDVKHVSLSNTRGPDWSALWSILYCKCSLLFRESSLMPKMPPQPLPWQQMNKDLRRTPAVHEMQLFSAAAGLYVTVPKNSSAVCSQMPAAQENIWLVTREERRCVLNVTMCNLIAGMFGCCRSGRFTEVSRKWKWCRQIAKICEIEAGRACSTSFWTVGTVCITVYEKWKEALTAWAAGARDKTLKRLKKQNASKM